MWEKCGMPVLQYMRIEEQRDWSYEDLEKWIKNEPIEKGIFPCIPLHFCYFAKVRRRTVRGDFFNCTT